MTSYSTTLAVSLRDHCLAEHRQLELLLERLIAAVEANALDDMTRLWTEFDTSLHRHLRLEEAHLVPVLQRTSEREARVIIQEHQHIRARVTSLGIALDLHTVRLDSVRNFIDELRAHAANEERLLYQWMDKHLDEPRKAALIETLAAIV